MLAAAEHTRMRGYIVVSLLTGARTEELRALTWDHVDLTGKPDHDPPVPPHIAVWRSIRAGADTKTRKSRRTLALPRRCVAALEAQRRQQDQDRIIAAARWQDHHLVFASRVGTPLDIQRGNSRPIVTQLVTQRSGASSYTRVNWPLSRLDGIGVIRRYSNRPDLLEQLRKVAVMMLDGGQDDGTGAMVAVEYGVRSRRLRDRLFSEDLQTMIDLYRSGATAKAVAEKFGVSLRSVKRLLHRHGVRRKGRV